jgi:hypothetical protein
MSWREALLGRFGGGAFTGITLGRWLRVLREIHLAVDRPYWGRAAVTTLASIPNTLLAAWENLCYGRKVSNTRVAGRASLLAACPGLLKAKGHPLV